MQKILDMVCMPLVLIGALNYGLVALFGFDIFGEIGGLTNGNIAFVLQLLVAIAAVIVAAGYARK